MLGGLLYLLRQLERWLHQHIFKVGWLVTNQFQTTTILYYAFFLPGIVLNQFIVWAVAGLLNVRADRSIAWPEKQEIGELKLNFIKLSKNVGAFRLAIISTAPLVIAIALVWHIANNILNIPGFLSMMRDGTLTNLTEAINSFTAATDFWIWVYLAFTISNTMMPDFQNLRGWRIVISALAIIIVVLYILGAGNAVLLDAMRGPITNSLNALSSIFAVIIGLNLFMVAVLGTLEAIIERITGHSATFENGKMKTMRRSEMLAERAKALAVTQKPTKAVAAPAGPPSIYKLQFPIPPAPGKEAVTRDEGTVVSLPAATTSQPQTSILEGRGGPVLIPGTAAPKINPPPQAAKPPALSAPTTTPSKPPIKDDEADEDEDVDDLDYEDFEDPA